MLKILCALLLSVNLHQAFTQERIRLIELGGGCSLYKLNDAAVSSLLYRGTVGMAEAGYHARKDLRMDIVQIRFTVGSLAPVIETETSLRLIRADVNWLFLKKIKSIQGTTTLFAGGHLLNHIGNTFHSLWPNNNFSYHYGHAAGPSFSCRIQPPERPYQMLFHLSVPLAAYVIRPGLATEYPEELARLGYTSIPAFYLGGRFASIATYQRVFTALSLTLPLTGPVLFRTSYQWDLVRYSTDNVIISADHTMLMTISYKF